MGVMRKQRETVRFDAEKNCAYCGDVVKDGDGWYTKNKLLVCKTCKPLFITSLKKIRPTPKPKVEV